MTAERGGPDIPEWARAERQSDLRWIAENLPSFWPVAQAQFSAQGRGMVVIDTTQQPNPNAGHPMYYISSALAEQTGDEDTKRMLAEYDPRREFVVLMLKAEGRVSAYRVQPLQRNSERVQRGRPRRGRG